MKDSAAHNREYRKRNPQKAKAHAMVWHRIRTGELVPQPCERCGESKTHAHHEDYTKPLEVTWLCQPCHVARHKELVQAAGFVPKVLARGPKKGVEYPKSTQLPIAQKMRAAGKTYPEIALALGVTKGTVYKWLNNVDYK